MGIDLSMDRARRLAQWYRKIPGVTQARVLCEDGRWLVHVYHRGCHVGYKARECTPGMELVFREYIAADLARATNGRGRDDVG